MMRMRGFVLIAGPVCLALLLSWPVWPWLWGEWWSNPYYSHGLIVLPLSVYLGWRRLSGFRGSAGYVGDSRGLVLLLISVGALVAFLDLRAYYLAGFALVGLAAGLLWLFLGAEALCQLSFPLAFFSLALPLPFVERATLPLALWTGSCSTSLSAWLGLPLVINGNAISLPNAELVIGAQCSGMNSLTALTALTALVAYVLIGPLWGRIALLCLAAPLAVLGNILRVTNLLFVAHYWGADVAFRYYHDFSAPFFFLVALALLFPLSRMLQCRHVRFDRF